MGGEVVDAIFLGFWWKFRKSLPQKGREAGNRSNRYLCPRTYVTYVSSLNKGEGRVKGELILCFICVPLWFQDSVQKMFHEHVPLSYCAKTQNLIYRAIRLIP